MPRRPRYREGTVFGVPVGDGLYATGLVAAGAKDLLFGYFFGPALPRVPELSDLAGRTGRDAILATKFGGYGLRSGQWPVAGALPDWRRDDFPLPPFRHRQAGQDRETWVLRQYGPENLVIPIRIAKVSSQVAHKAPDDAFKGHVLVVEDLARRLGLPQPDIRRAGPTYAEPTGVSGAAPEGLLLRSDDAADFLAGVAASRGSVTPELRTAMAIVAEETGYIEAPEMISALVAVALTAASVSGTIALPKSAVDALRGRKINVTPDLASLANKVLDRAASEQSEYQELVEEGLGKDALPKMIGCFREALAARPADS